MKVRSNYAGYTEALERYFGKLLPLVTDLQVCPILIRRGLLLLLH